MFRKLISSLPFSPSLIYQLADYSKHLKFESRIRTVGLILASVAVGLQIFGQLLLPYPAGLQASQHQEVLGASTAMTALSAVSSPGSNPQEASAVVAWPDLSPMEGFLMSALFLILAGFFCMRDRLLSKELSLIKADFTSGGGV